MYCLWRWFWLSLRINVNSYLYNNWWVIMPSQQLLQRPMHSLQPTSPPQGIYSSPLAMLTMSASSLVWCIYPIVPALLSQVTFVYSWFWSFQNILTQRSSMPIVHPDKPKTADLHSRSRKRILQWQGIQNGNYTWEWWGWRLIIIPNPFWFFQGWVSISQSLRCTCRGCRIHSCTDPHSSRYNKN